MSGPVASILLVDDEPTNLLALEAILEPLQQNLVRAESGKAALRQALRTDYAVILLDVQMPEVDGFETAELLRKRARTRDVPIIFLTAMHKDRNFVSRGYGVGAVDYLFKPYEPDMLRAKVAVFVELARKNGIIRAQNAALERRYADLADSMPLLVWTTDASGQILYANRRWDEIAKGARDFAAVVAPPDLPRFLDEWSTALARGVEWEAELSFGTAASGFRAQLVRVVPRRDEGGEITSWIGTSTDIDARVRADKSKDVFLATLSHELRTPLHAIVGWTDMMRSGSLAEGELGRAIDTIDRNAHALNHLVADLLDVSRIVTGSLKLDSELVGLAAVVEAAVEGARPQCASKRVALDVSLERVGCVMGDAERLRQVIGNLLSNAVKFTPEGGRIAVRVTREGQSGRIVVKDTGEGIAADLLPHVFERFRQADDARTRGLGLGLAIVKHLVEQHSGTVAVDSAGPGTGATLTVLLPIAAEESPVEDETSPSPPASAQPQLAGVHVLVVEDDPDGNELITTILERYGARVTPVGTAAAALEALESERPDVLVSDIGLPDSDGLELIKMVRGSAMAKGLPAIALTAYASRQDAAMAIGAGFDAHVAKPVQPCTLGIAIARLVGGTISQPEA